MYIKKRGDTKSNALRVYKEYTKEAKRLNHRGRDRNKNITCPYLKPNQSMKLTSKEELKSINTLTQDQRLYTKEFFNLWSESSSLANANIFISFHTVQNKHKGVICQAFLRTLPTKAPCHLRRVSFTEQERIQATPTREKRRFQRTRVFAQWRRRWSTISTSERHRKHLLAKKCPLLWSLPSKENYLRRHTRPPNTTTRKQRRISGLQDRIKRLDQKGITSWSCLNHSIFHLPITLCKK